MESDLKDILRGRFKSAFVSSSDIFEKCRLFTQAQVAREMGVYPYFQPLSQNEGPVAEINGEKVVMLGSNNYLGLTMHPKVREASAKAALRFGTSCTGSRFLNGTFEIHEELERDLAEFLGKESALVFSTGYQTNLGIFSALLGRNDFAIVDQKAHASISDGCALAVGKKVTFKHNDLKELEEVLKSLDPSFGKMVVVDGVYSMEGDISPLPEILEISKSYGVRVLVDDAHGLGVLGEGKGTPAQFNVQDKVDLIMGTFSKSLASIGGFVAGDFQVIDYIKHFGRPMIFSAGLPPPCVASAHAALKIIKEEKEIIKRLWKNTEKIREGLKSIGLDTGDSQTPIIPVILKDEALTIMFWRKLREEGVYANPVIYPAVPKNGALLRTSVMATHTEEHLDFALEKFEKVKKSLCL